MIRLHLLPSAAALLLLSLAFLAPAVEAQTAQAAFPNALAPEAKAAFDQALKSYAGKDVLVAVGHFLKAYASDARVLTLDDQGLLAGSIADLQNRVAAAPQDLDLNFKLAELTNIQGYSEDSLKYYKKVLALAPASTQAAVAREEVRKLEAAIQAAHAATAAANAGSGATGVPPPQDQNTAKPGGPEEAALNQVKQLQDDLQKARDEVEESTQKLDKLQKEYDDLKKKADKWYFYYTRFFADPANIQKLQGGQ
jgi:hypothetical protein